MACSHKPATSRHCSARAARMARACGHAVAPVLVGVTDQQQTRRLAWFMLLLLPVAPPPPCSSCPSPSSRLAHGSVADLQQELLQQGPPGAALPQQGTPARATGPSPLRAIAAVVAALLGALLYVPRSMCRAVGALSSGQLVVCAIGCGIMAMQAALFLQQRQQFEQLQAHHAATQLAHVQAAPAGGDASDSAQFVAAQGAAVAALSTRLASLQQAVETLQAHSQGWQAQVDALAQAAAALAAHLQQPR